MSDPSTPPPPPLPGEMDTPGPAVASVAGAVPPGCPTRTRLWSRGALSDEGFPAQEIARRLAADPESMVWLDLFDPGPEDLRVVTEEFGLHPLAVEDAVADRQRPKIDRYHSHLFLNVYATAFDPDDTVLTTAEISAFVTERALITVRKAAFDLDALLARWDGAAGLASLGVGYLVHGLLDAVVDGHSEAVDRVDDAVDDLEESLFDRQGDSGFRRRGFELRKSLVQLRRVVLPMRELLRQLLRPDLYDGKASWVPEPLVPYFEDVHDHALSAAEGVEGVRDLLVSILDTSLNQQSNDLNEITKKLASWAAIIAVPTAVTGFYGQNVPYPGFSKPWGLFTSVSVMVFLAAGLYALLRRRGWM